MTHSSQVRVKVLDVSVADTVKLKKIFQLSTNRKRQYIWSEDDADILVTANPNTPKYEKTLLITLGPRESFPDSTAHINPPLIGIRVLKALDALQLPTPKTIDIPGTEVTQELPVAEVVIANVAPPMLASNFDPTIEAESAHNILVVDDSPIIHKALKLELQQADFSSVIDYAESGEQCLDLIAEKKYDLIFLDVMMPGINGYDTCTEIRKNPLFKRTPIIMLSAKSSPLDEVKGVIAGCTTYLTKPIQHDDFQKLLVRMDNWLEKRKTTH